MKIPEEPREVPRRVPTIRPEFAVERGWGEGVARTHTNLRSHALDQEPFVLGASLGTFGMHTKLPEARTA